MVQMLPDLRTRVKQSEHLTYPLSMSSIRRRRQELEEIDNNFQDVTFAIQGAAF